MKGYGNLIHKLLSWKNLILTLKSPGKKLYEPCIISILRLNRNDKQVQNSYPFNVPEAFLQTNSICESSLSYGTKVGFTDLKDKDQKYQVENSITVVSTSDQD